MAAGGQIQTYERGVIVARKTGGTFVVYGEIYAQYYRLGGVTGLLGLPLSDVAATGASGYGAHFDGGDIYWSVQTGAREIHGAIRDRWLALGGPTSVLGYPTSDETSLLRNGTEVGRYNTFQNGGAIYWSGATGAWDVYGAIAGLWQGTYGGPNGALGFPISGETNTPDAGGRYNEFEHGIIVWHGSGTYAGAYGLFDLEFLLDHFESDWGSYHVQVKIDATNPNASCDTWFPSESDYTSNPSVQQTVLTLPAVRASTVVNVWMDGLGRHNLGIGSDERLGIFQMRYDITNLWGILENPTHPVNQNLDAGHHLNCIFSLKSPAPPNPNVPFRRQFFWPFKNFDTAEMSNATYAQTFGDVHEDETAYWHPFDALFFDLVYKGVGAGGNCFGMCLEALYAIADRSVFSEPIYDNPTIQYSSNLQGGGEPGPGDARFTGPINIKHGYQLGDRMIGYFLEEYVAGHTHDPVDAFKRSRAAFDAGDRPIISIIQDSGFGSGHALLPYAWDDTGTPWTIEVANPNWPYALQHDDAAPVCRILVDAQANTYSFVMGYNKDGSPDSWSGGDSSGGRMFHIPFSVLNSEPNTPIDDVLALIASGAYIILSGDGQTTQITDQNGRTFAATAAAQRIPNMASVPRIAADPSLQANDHALASATVDNDLLVRPVRLAAQPAPEMYHLRRPPAFKSAPSTRTPVGATLKTTDSFSALTSLHPGEDATLTWDIQSTGNSTYVWAMRSPAGSVVATIPVDAGAAHDVIHVAGVVQSLPAITLQRKNGPAKTASITLVGPATGGSERTCIFELTGVPLGAGAGVTLQLSSGGSEVQIVNPGSAATIGVRMQSGANPANSAARNVVAGANGVLAVSPANWTADAIAKSPVTVKQLDKLGGTVLKQSSV
jgi:hypothetical protein